MLDLVGNRFSHVAFHVISAGCDFLHIISDINEIIFCDNLHLIFL